MEGKRFNTLDRAVEFLALGAVFPQPTRVVHHAVLTDRGSLALTFLDVPVLEAALGFRQGLLVLFVVLLFVFVLGRLAGNCQHGRDYDGEEGFKNCSGERGGGDHEGASSSSPQVLKSVHQESNRAIILSRAWHDSE